MRSSARPAAAVRFEPESPSGILSSLTGETVIVTFEKKRSPRLCWMREKGVFSVPLMCIGSIFACVWSAICATPAETFIGLPMVVGCSSGKMTQRPPFLSRLRKYLRVSGASASRMCVSAIGRKKRAKRFFVSLRSIAKGTFSGRKAARISGSMKET